MKILLKLGLLAFCLLIFPIKPRSFASGHLAINNPYYVRPTRTADTRIKVEIIVRDDVDDDVIDRIQEVTFDGKKLSLNPQDFLGNRGSFYFKTLAGRHEITWTISRKTGWPSNQTYRKTIEIPSTATLYYIEIYRDEMTTQAIQ